MKQKLSLAIVLLIAVSITATLQSTLNDSSVEPQTSKSGWSDYRVLESDRIKSSEECYGYSFYDGCIQDKDSNSGGDNQ